MLMVIRLRSPPYKQVGQRQRGFGLADAARPDQQEDADRLAGIVQAGPRGADALADHVERMV